MKRKKRGRWESLSYQSKGSVIGAGLGAAVVILLLLLSFFDCAALKCSLENALFYLLTFVFAGFGIGFITEFFVHWTEYRELYKVPVWEKTGMLFFTANLLLFVLAVYNFYRLHDFLEIFYSFPMNFAEHVLHICSGPDACGVYAFLGFYVWVSVAAILLGALTGYVLDKIIVYLIHAAQEVDFLSHRHSKKQDRISTVIVVMLILLTPALLLLSNIYFAAYDFDFYREEFAKYSPDIAGREAITSNMLNYLQDRNAGAEMISSFDEAERAHLQDVKQVMQRGMLLVFILVIIGIALLTFLCVMDMYHFVKDLGFSALFGGALTTLLTFIAYLWLLNFDSAFAAFHELFFEAGTWIFAPGSLLTTLLPEQFWIDISHRIIGNTLLAAMIVMVMGVTLMLLTKNFGRNR